MIDQDPDDSERCKVYIVLYTTEKCYYFIFILLRECIRALYLDRIYQSCMIKYIVFVIR